MKHVKGCRRTLTMAGALEIIIRNCGIAGFFGLENPAQAFCYRKTLRSRPVLDGPNVCPACGWSSTGCSARRFPSSHNLQFHTWRMLSPAAPASVRDGNSVSCFIHTELCGGIQDLFIPAGKELRRIASAT